MKLYVYRSVYSSPWQFIRTTYMFSFLSLKCKKTVFLRKKNWYFHFLRFSFFCLSLMWLGLLNRRIFGQWVLFKDICSSNLCEYRLFFVFDFPHYSRNIFDYWLRNIVLFTTVEILLLLDLAMLYVWKTCAALHEKTMLTLVAFTAGIWCAVFSITSVHHNFFLLWINLLENTASRRMDSTHKFDFHLKSFLSMYILYVYIRTWKCPERS